ncbi:hypothetical protein CVV68_10645 [Arthrobacter livingstonensis]|uniref:DUF6318 domain-containing protein n=1 Tax=Arthrobacter livingstonensis TaxID=670078 RepID=A0A2V5L7H9_9MICC|nr:DUF6318 family protein [Arthrobacter livingstonensis]PYI67198.1 hypothetical protein CVV68_10645 [Arthrobacter livingstonensis]
MAAAFLTLALATALSLTGCTSKGAPPSAGTAPATATATVPATSSAPTTPPPAPVYKPATANGPAQNVPVPVLPPKAKEFSKTGLEEFARYWYSTLGYAYETGDTDPMMAITDAGCTTCANVKKTVVPWNEEGRWIVGGQMKVISSDSKFVKTPDDTYQAIVIIQQMQVSFHKNPGTAFKTLPATIARPDIVVARYSGGIWTADTAEHLTSE